MLSVQTEESFMGRILLGANYYPEDWDESLIDFDIEKIVAAVTKAGYEAE